MKSINRFFYGPTPEERVREWRQKLRGEERKLDREIRNVSSVIKGWCRGRMSGRCNSDCLLYEACRIMSRRAAALATLELT